jgi:hypothetical protein
LNITPTAGARTLSQRNPAAMPAPEFTVEECTGKKVFSEKTTNRQLSYCFTRKHHGGGSPGDSCWLPGLPEPEEFEVFNMADANDLADEDNNLYGVRIRTVGATRDILELGRWHEMIARFWEPPNQDHWHGHPVWLVSEDAPDSLRKRKKCPPQRVFDRIVERGIMKQREACRLKLGKHLKRLAGE